MNEKTIVSSNLTLNLDNKKCIDTIPSSEGVNQAN